MSVPDLIVVTEAAEEAAVELAAAVLLAASLLAGAALDGAALEEELLWPHAARERVIAAASKNAAAFFVFFITNLLYVFARYLSSDCFIIV